MTRRTFQLLLPAFMIVPAGAYYAGGWAAITVEDLPDYVVAGEAVDLSYVVRQHGVRRLGGLNGSVSATAGNRKANADARAGGEEGRYVASLTLPQPGDWTITINSGFGPSRTTLLPMRVVDRNASAPPALTDGARGRRLFVAKGCVTCHVHKDVDKSGLVPLGPELTRARYPGDYLARFLADPTIPTAGSGPRPGPTRMPDLDLKPREIASLVSFINATSQVSRR